MNKPATPVIKNEAVQVGGKVRLGSAMPHMAASSGAVASGQSQHAAAPATARIVRTAADHVVIEVACPCGARTMLRCNY
jgi:hypothetical protein